MSRLRNKTFSFLGDSISSFEGWNPHGYPYHYSRRNGNETLVRCPEETWWHMVVTHFEGELLVNDSWSGSCVSKPRFGEIESYGCSDARTGNLASYGVEPDHIVVFIGTNDRGYGLPLVSEDRSDLGVIENAYGAMLDKLKRHYRHAVIWCCTFPPTVNRFLPESRPLAVWHGRPAADYSECVAKAARERGCRVIDLANGDVVSTADGLHPDFEGMETIAAAVIREMERVYGN